MAVAEPPPQSTNLNSSTVAAEHPLDQWLKQVVSGLISATVAAWLLGITQLESAGWISATLVVEGCSIVIWTFLHERKSFKAKFFRAISLVPLILGLTLFWKWLDNMPPGGLSATLHSGQIKPPTGSELPTVPQPVPTVVPQPNNPRLLSPDSTPSLEEMPTYHPPPKMPHRQSFN